MLALGATGILLLGLIPPPPAAVGSAEQPIRLTGLARDFRSTHADFDVALSCVTCFGLHAGTIRSTLDLADRPVLAAVPGYRVTTPWQDAAGGLIAPHLFTAAGSDACGNALADIAGVAGLGGYGGITSAGTFEEWFHDRLGTNLSLPATIDLVPVGGGVYEHVDDEFFPLDDRCFGNEGDEHNFFFTFAVAAALTYRECTGQFVELEGGDGAWVFLDGDLVIDLGGVMSGAEQVVELDRLGLVDGEQYDLQMFYAQRYRLASTFRLRTNVELSPTGVPPAMTATFD